MADQEHLNILKQGVEKWNQWKKEHADIQPDLREANLFLADLTNANLSHADLLHANLSCATLTGAILMGANLHFAELRDANLNGANLTHAILLDADLRRARLKEANLSHAQLTHAALKDAQLSHAILTNAQMHFVDLRRTDLTSVDLRFAYLRQVNLSEADLSEALVGGTIFVDIDLSPVKGLDWIQHQAASEISLSTIYRSKGHIPEIFLQGAGVPDSFLGYIRSLAGKLLDYYSCFISYSSKDQAFAERLHADLQSKGVRCWFAPDDLKWGEPILTGIDEAIRLHDKLLLVLSKSSVASGWVEREVKTALAKERKEKSTVLFPVRVDKAIFESPFDWATEIRHERNIGDFTGWENNDAYQNAFTRLLRDLKAASQ